MEKFEIGDIVAFKTHPFEKNLTNLLISGESSLIPPLMLVVETNISTADVYSQKDGKKIQEKNMPYKCKCVWYCTKTGLFKEEDFITNQIKLISKRDGSLLDINDIVGKCVFFKTLRLEQSKFFSITDSNKNLSEAKFLQKNLHISPSMVVIDIIEQERATEKVSQNKFRKEISDTLVKCKYYNPIQSKHSEVILPKEVIIRLPVPDIGLLSRLNEVILNNRFIFWKASEDNLHVVLPLEIRSENSFIGIRIYDYVQNIYTIVNNLSEFQLNQENIRENYFVERNQNLTLDKVAQLINQGNVRITYKDRNGNVTLRTIRVLEILNNDVNNPIIRSSCKLRRAERHFRLAGILSAEILQEYIG